MCSPVRDTFFFFFFRFESATKVTPKTNVFNLNDFSASGDLDGTMTFPSNRPRAQLHSVRHGARFLRNNVRRDNHPARPPFHLCSPTLDCTPGACGRRAFIRAGAERGRGAGGTRCASSAANETRPRTSYAGSAGSGGGSAGGVGLREGSFPPGCFISLFIVTFCSVLHATLWWWKPCQYVFVNYSSRVFFYVAGRSRTRAPYHSPSRWEE